MRVRAWGSTGGLVTAGCSEDGKIFPQGLNNWPGPHPAGFAVPQEWPGESSEEEGNEEDEAVEEEEYASSDSDAE